MNKILGFSLIELLVVVAIFSILAAVAAPIYQRYVIRARLGELVQLMDSMVLKSINYATINGYFPNAYQLGLSATVNSILADNSISSGMSRYIAQTGNSILFEDDSTTCPSGSGQRGRVWIWANASALGFNPSFVNNLDMQCLLYNTAGNLIEQKCMYEVWGPNGTCDGSDWITGWLNENTFTNCTAPNYGSFVSSSAWLNAVCM